MATSALLDEPRSLLACVICTIVAFGLLGRPGAGGRSSGGARYLNLARLGSNFGYGLSQRRSSPYSFDQPSLHQKLSTCTQGVIKRGASVLVTMLTFVSALGDQRVGFSGEQPRDWLQGSMCGNIVP